MQEDNRSFRSSFFTSGTISLIFLLLLLCPVSGAQVPAQGKVLVAIYAVGGSLETDYGLITDDIVQMVKGAANTTPQTIEVLVAYGGSEKPGWQGMKVATIRNLSHDLADDGAVGNTSDAIAVFPDVSMGDAGALGEYLHLIRSGYDYDRVFLILIGHGEAYTGMLFDQNHGDDPLTIPELVAGLQTGGFNVEMIGLDTCLMSTLEVASSLSGYSRYLIASEESEPAEGWRYDALIPYLAEHPDAPVSDIGGVLLRTYLENPVKGKTLSVLDLTNVGDVTSHLDHLSKLLIPALETSGGYSEISDIINSTQQFGLTGKGILDPATMDLIGFGEQVETMNSGLFAEPAADLVNATRQMVLLSGHDDLVPSAQGIAILSPIQINSAFYRYYQNEATITPSWDRFMIRYLEWSDSIKNGTSLIQ